MLTIILQPLYVYRFYLTKKHPLGGYGVIQQPSGQDYGLSNVHDGQVDIFPPEGEGGQKWSKSRPHGY